MGFLCVGRRGRSSFLDVCKLVANSEHMDRMEDDLQEGTTGPLLVQISYSVNRASQLQ